MKHRFIYILSPNDSVIRELLYMRLYHVNNI